MGRKGFDGGRAGGDCGGNRAPPRIFPIFGKVHATYSLVYLDFYGLKEPPFNITPNPRYLYFSAKHREALNYLLYGIQERKGFVQITGEVGAGKTTLCRALLA